MHRIYVETQHASVTHGRFQNIHWPATSAGRGAASLTDCCHCPAPLSGRGNHSSPTLFGLLTCSIRAQTHCTISAIFNSLSLGVLHNLNCMWVHFIEMLSQKDFWWSIETFFIDLIWCKLLPSFLYSFIVVLTLHASSRLCFAPVKLLYNVNFSLRLIKSICLSIYLKQVRAGWIIDFQSKSNFPVKTIITKKQKNGK